MSDSKFDFDQFIKTDLGYFEDQPVKLLSDRDDFADSVSEDEDDNDEINKKTSNTTQPSPSPLHNNMIKDDIPEEAEDDYGDLNASKRYQSVDDDDNMGDYNGEQLNESKDYDYDSDFLDDSQETSRQTRNEPQVDSDTDQDTYRKSFNDISPKQSNLSSEKNERSKPSRVMYSSSNEKLSSKASSQISGKRRQISVSNSSISNSKYSDNSSNNSDGNLSDNDLYSIHSEIPRQKPKKTVKKTLPNNIYQGKRPHSLPNNGRPPNGTNNKRYGSIQNKRGRGRGQNTGRGNNMVRSDDRGQLVNRVLSANRNKSRALHNVIHDLKQQIETLSVENKDLKRAARLQDREIRKLDNAEAELPYLLKKHSNEMLVLQEKFRRQKEQSDKSREELKRREHELYTTKERLLKYETMAKDKKLGERSKLSKKLEELEIILGDKDKKIAELTRAVQLHEKVRSRELKEKNEKYKKAVDEMKRLEQEQKDLLRKLKDKEKALEVTNIYSQRINQRRGSDGTERTNFIFSSSDPIPTPIRRHQEEQESEYAQSVLAQSTKKAFLTENSVAGSEDRTGKMITIDFEADGEKQDQLDNTLSPRGKKSSPRSNKNIRHVSDAPVKTLVSETKESEEIDEEDDFYSDQKQSEDERRLLEIDKRITDLKRRDEIERREQEQRKLQAEKELEERLAKLEADRKVKEKKEEESRKKKEKEIKEQILQEENKRLEEERRREEEFQRTLAEQQDSKELQEKSLKESESKNKGVSEQQRKKDLLLAKMQAIDRGENPDVVAQPSQLKQESKSKKKPIFLENDSSSKPLKESSMISHEPLDFSGNAQKNKRNIPIRNVADGDFSNSNRRNSWEFKQTDENLHKGLPSHSSTENSPALKRRSSKDSDELKLRSSSGKVVGRRRESLSSGEVKNRRNRDLFGENETDTVYSPTGIRDSPLQSNKKNKKNNLFDAFEDPFKTAKTASDSSNKNVNKTDKLVFSSDEEETDFPTYGLSKPQRQFKGASLNKKSPSRSSSTFNDDDLDTMILA